MLTRFCFLSYIIGANVMIILDAYVPVAPLGVRSGIVWGVALVWLTGVHTVDKARRRRGLA
jgi:hypothetical protein